MCVKVEGDGSGSHTVEVIIIEKRISDGSGSSIADNVVSKVCSNIYGDNAVKLDFNLFTQLVEQEKSGHCTLTTLPIDDAEKVKRQIKQEIIANHGLTKEEFGRSFVVLAAVVSC